MMASYRIVSTDYSFLCHHGIKGQRWGVRRFQDEQGRLTAAGKARYSKSNPGMGETIYQRALQKEPAITKAVRSAVEEAGGQLYGLDHRLKTVESLNRKIETDAKEKNITLQQAADSIKDAVRYTAVSSDSQFVKNYDSIKKSLRELGYNEVRCRNYFDLFLQGKVSHKQLTSVFTDPDGYQFELQFHTPSSIQAKEKKTPLYEEARDQNTTLERKAELIQQMNKLMASVSDPVDVRKIRTYG